MKHASDKTPLPGARPEATAPASTVIDSRQLLSPGQTTLYIDHGGQRYQLRVTRENKLILTK